MNLLEFTEKGIYCEKADLYIDPWQPVEKAIVTHGHSDHARWGTKNYLCQKDSKEILKHRLGADISLQTLDYRQKININGVNITLFPAGHIVGSAQILAESNGERWVVSGDYKLEQDPLTPTFEPVPCDVFVTESTFGLPVYSWKNPEDVYHEINQWWQENRKEGLVSILTGYTLGKAQRLLHALDTSIGPVYLHGAIYNINQILINQHLPLYDAPKVTSDHKKEDFKGAMILAPPSAVGSPWIKKFVPYSIGTASGWMSLRGTRRRRSVDRGFVLSDHADWKGLNKAIKATGAQKIIITHGYRDVFCRWLNECGYDARVEDTLFEGELSEIGESTVEKEEV